MNSYRCTKCGLTTRAGLASCPSCGMAFPEEKPLTFSPEKSNSIFSRIGSFVKAPSVKAEQRSRLTLTLRNAVHDGQISEAELGAINNIISESELSVTEVLSLKTAIFNELVGSYLADRRITEGERTSILDVGNSLGIDQLEMARIEDRIRFHWYLNYIETCAFEHLPNSENPDVVLKRDELQYSAFPSQMLEEKVISRRMVGGSHGVSIRLMKGVSYRVGQSRGEMVSETGIVPVSVGDFVITSKRLIFTGDRKSFNTSYDKLLDFQLFTNGIRISTTSKQKPTTLQFYSTEAAEIAGVYISRVLNES